MMTNIDVFDEYAHKFDLENKDIKGKYTHSFRVMQISKELAASLNLSEYDINLASDIGLLHDIGRFKQLEEFSSYDDVKTIDHADFGADVLFKDKMIDKFNINQDDYKIIELAIRNHNKFKIEDGLNDRELLFCKIIRDADKLDILNRLCILKDFELKIDKNKQITDTISSDFFKGKQANKLYTKNENDFTLLFLSYIFDINYKFSFNYLENKHIIEKFKEVVNCKIFDKYIEFADKYIKERVD